MRFRHHFARLSPCEILYRIKVRDCIWWNQIFSLILLVGICFRALFKTLKLWLIDWFGFSGSLRRYFSLYRAVSQREGERGEKGQRRVKIFKQPAQSTIGPCPTIIQIVGCPGTGSWPRTIAPPDHPSWNYGFLELEYYYWHHVTVTWADPDTQKPCRWKASSSPKVIYVAYIPTMFAKHIEGVN